MSLPDSVEDPQKLFECAAHNIRDTRSFSMNKVEIITACAAVQGSTCAADTLCV